MQLVTLLLLQLAAVALAAPRNESDEQMCREYTALHANNTWRQPNGALHFPYLVPAGPVRSATHALGRSLLDLCCGSLSCALHSRVWISTSNAGIGTPSFLALPR